MRPGTMVKRGLLVVVGGLLLGCSGADEHPPAAEGSGAWSPSKVAPSRDVSAPEPSGDAELQVSVVSVVPSFVGTLRATVTNEAGAVVTGTFVEVGSALAQGTHDFSFVLPGGGGYTVSFVAATAEPKPRTCHATIGALTLAVGVTARAQLFGWDCGDGYEAALGSDGCGRLVNWSFVGRTSAETGQPVPLFASTRAASQAWSIPEPGLGEFSEPGSSRTEFHCAKAAGAVPLTLLLTDGACRETVSQTVACR